MAGTAFGRIFFTDASHATQEDSSSAIQSIAACASMYLAKRSVVRSSSLSTEPLAACSIAWARCSTSHMTATSASWLA